MALFSYNLIFLSYKNQETFWFFWEKVVNFLGFSFLSLVASVFAQVMCSSQDGVGTQGNKCPFPQMDDAKKTHTQFKLDVTHKLGSHV